MLQNNVWNGSAVGEQCITPLWEEGAEAGFVVRPNPSISVDDTSPAPYAALVLGWHFGEFSGAYSSAKTVGEVTQVPSTWSFTVPNSGTHNVAYDIWLHPTEAAPQGPTGGLELMIWPAYREATPIGTLATTADLAGASWEVWTGNNGAWDVVTFRRVTNARSFEADLLEFIDAVATVSSVALDDSWYLLGIEAGFEIWQSDEPLTTDRFLARVQ
jgi:hypothetical protein